MLKAAPNIQVGASQILTGLEAISAPTRVPGAGPLSRRKCGLRAAPGDAIDEVPVFICQPVYLLWSSILAAGGWFLAASRPSGLVPPGEGFGCISACPDDSVKTACETAGPPSAQERWSGFYGRGAERVAG
jgi:hypothetical protein